MAKHSAEQNGLGQRILESAGIDPNICTSVVFESRVGEIEKATVEFYTETEGIQVGEFVRVNDGGKGRSRGSRSGCWMLRW